MERFDYAEELKTILQPFHEAPSSAARAQVLRELAIKIKYLSTIQEKEYVICCLLRNTPPLVPGTLEETAMLQCLQAGEPSVLITATLRILQEIPQSLTALELSLTLLKQIMSTRPTTDAQEWLSLLTPESVERWVNLLIRVPNLVANACQAFQVPFPAWTVQARYFPKMVDHAVCWCLLAEKRPTIQSRQMYLLSLIKHMLRRGGEEITKGLYQAYERGDSLPALYNIVANILSDLSPREFAILSRSMMRHILSVCPVPLGKDRYAHPWLDETLRKVVLRSTLHADALVELLLFSADPHHDVAYITASMLANITESHDDDSSSVDSDESSPEDTLLRRHLIAVVDRWSRPNYVLETPNRQQSHVTAFLRFGMKLLCEPKEDAASELVASVLEGITCRLSSTDPDIRRDGMQIAVLLANRLGEKLEFDELQDSHNGEVEATNIPEERKPVNVAEKIAQKSRRRFRNADPDAPYISEDDDSTEKSGDSWDDEEEDAPFDLEDDEEDLADTAKPRFLSDCLDLLRTPETEDYASSRHETALAELSQLVRSRPMDLPDIAATIAFELVHMENKFDIKGFADMVSSSLRSLAVEEPLLVGETLIQEVFQDIGLSDRICALRALSEAAYEMARLFGLEQHNLSTKQIS
jgi:telomere length regulation protein